MKSRSIVGGCILIALGLILLLSNFGLIPGFGLLLKKWWPLLLIILGVLAVLRRSRPPFR